MSKAAKDIIPLTLAHLPGVLQQTLAATDATDWAEQLRQWAKQAEVPGYLADLARIEQALHLVKNYTPAETAPSQTLQVNPTLNLIEVDWHPLLPLLEGQQVTPEVSQRILAVWRDPQRGEIRQAVMQARELLAIKVVVEQLDPHTVAEAAQQPVGTIDYAIEQAIYQGLLLAPPSRLRRSEEAYPLPLPTPEKFLQAEVFTLQWHITHRCDLHCRHCYDRSKRVDVALNKGLEILDQLRDFCSNNHVGGQVSFSGGNPFLHPQFLDLYQAAHDRNLNLAILGNPVSEIQLDNLLRIAKPAFYQVSLEGLQEHNDAIRGLGNYASVMTFLELLKRKGIYSMVMLTLTRANMAQVLELAEKLRDRVDLFTYNRLSMVGEGANLESPLAEEYQAFVRAYLEAKKTNPVLALKDSLINIEREERGLELFGGCTGFGCGAAFNFVSLLPDGEVHACRKFPSPIGHIHQQSLTEIYTSAAAQSYRRGCEECAPCRLRPVCGGCLAVAYGWGVDPLKEKDPACFMKK